MSKRIPLEGKKIGHLTVMEYLGKSKYRCVCDCGNTTVVSAKNLTRGHTTSCGCAKCGENLAGKRFGRLTAIKSIYNKKENRAYYECVCDCGNIVTVRRDCLLSGTTKSCGCLSKERDFPQKWKDDFVDGTQLSKIQSKPTKSNKSGVVGVNWDKSRGKWQASLRFRGHKYNLGRFDSFDDAVDARKAAEKEIFGKYNNSK